MSVPPLLTPAPGPASGSLLGRITKASPVSALYAPASGGGGGGSNYPSDPTFSTITLNDSGIVQPNLIVDGALSISASGGINFQSNASLNAPSIYFPGDGSVNFVDGSNIVCQIQPDGNGYCSIAPGDGLGIGLTVSSINGNPSIASPLLVNPSLQSGGNIIIYDPSTTYTQDIVITTNNPTITGNALNGTIYHAPSGGASMIVGSADGGGGGTNYIIANTANSLVIFSPSGTLYTSTGLATADGSVTCGTLSAASGSITYNLNVSSINGFAPGATNYTSSMFIPYETTTPIANLASGSPINYSTVVLSPVYNAKQMIQISGNLKSQVEFAGSGNTNPPTNVAGNSNANFGIGLSIDGGAFINLTSLSFTNPNNTGLPAAFNSSNASFTFTSQYGSFQINPTYGFGSAGTEFCYTNLGEHTYQLRAWTDIYISTADPGANYNMFLNIPTWAQDGSNNAGLYVQAI